MNWMGGSRDKLKHGKRRAGRGRKGRRDALDSAFFGRAVPITQTPNPVQRQTNAATTNDGWQAQYDGMGSVAVKVGSQGAVPARAAAHGNPSLANAAVAPSLAYDYRWGDAQSWAPHVHQASAPAAGGMRVYSGPQRTLWHVSPVQPVEQPMRAYSTSQQSNEMRIPSQTAAQDAWQPVAVHDRSQPTASPLGGPAHAPVTSATLMRHTTSAMAPRAAPSRLLPGAPANFPAPAKKARLQPVSVSFLVVSCAIGLQVELGCIHSSSVHLMTCMRTQNTRAHSKTSSRSQA